MRPTRRLGIDSTARFRASPPLSALQKRLHRFPFVGKLRVVVSSSPSLALSNSTTAIPERDLPGEPGYQIAIGRRGKIIRYVLSPIGGESKSFFDLFGACLGGS